MKAAENAGLAKETREGVRDIVAAATFGERFVTKVLGQRLGLS